MIGRVDVLLRHGHRIGLAAALVIGAGLPACGPQPTSQAVGQTASPAVRTQPATGTAVEITKIDGNAISGVPDVAFKVDVELTTTRDDLAVCVLVHPMEADTWWVQNLPGFPNVNGGLKAQISSP